MSAATFSSIGVAPASVATPGEERCGVAEQDDETGKRAEKLRLEPRNKRGGIGGNIARRVCSRQRY